MSSLKKDIDAVIVAAVAQGWRASKTSSGHHQLYSPDKHTIVVVSDKSSEQHTFQNFLSDMKKGGYVECEARGATHSLGAALLAAKSSAPAKMDELNEPVSQQRLTLPQIVIGFLERRDAACTTEDIVMVVKHHRPQVERQSIVSQLSALASSGRIRHIARGLYGAAKKEEVPTQVTRGFSPVAHVASSAPSVVPLGNGLDHAVEHTLQNKGALAEELSFEARNRAVIEELFTMQAALIAALGRIEAIVQKLRPAGNG